MIPRHCRQECRTTVGMRAMYRGATLLSAGGAESGSWTRRTAPEQYMSWMYSAIDSQWACDSQWPSTYAALLQAV